ncbi:TonB-dependent receptor [Niveibacterium sp. 24ML]|uniref:TonB-dependent receptor domain-containing protein n=1 Tax=Niveibacterium sp. 24ML TaxID=2985512 RepID=UPI00226DCA69|nr:TonB-dependent receptor [Niveibacterium sp. 24ML]MCX9155963.1 TonB-dependent receptor [Niveibacterium sp. 24ML]
MKCLWVRPVSAAVLAAFSNAALATTAATEPPETVVITATRQPTRIAETLADVTVLERADIERAGNVSLTEYLGRQPGLQFYSNGGPGKASGLIVRGTSAAQSLVLVDGLRVGSATSGGASLEHLSLDDIERIEIVRGPQSALYGSDAMGGVVQVFTRRASAPFAADAYAGVGTYGSQDYAAGVSGRQGAFSGSLRASHTQTDGFSATTDAEKQPYSYDPDDDGYRRTSVSGSLGWKIAEGHALELSALQNKGRSWYDGGPGFDSHVDAKVATYGLALRDRFTDIWNSTLRAGRSIDDSRDYGPWNPDGVSFRTEQDQVSWQNDVRIGPGALMLGAEWLRQQATAEGSFDTDRTIGAFFAGWSAHYGEHRIQINLRNDDNSQFGAHTTGTLAWGWQFTEAWRARLGGGTSFRAPTFNDLYYPGYSNPDLKAEQGENVEAALAWAAGEGRASLTAYQNRVSDQIALDQNWQPQNISRARLQGVTLEAANTWGAWVVDGSLDWLDARNTDTDKQLARRAEWMAALNASYGTEAWRGGAELRYVGDRYDDAANLNKLDAYTLVNLFAHWSVAPQARLELRLDNLFDEQYETARGYGTAGRSVFAGVRVSTR